MKVVHHPVGNFPYPKTDSGRLTERRSRKPQKWREKETRFFFGSGGILGRLWATLSLSFPALHCSSSKGGNFQFDSRGRHGNTSHFGPPPPRAAPPPRGGGGIRFATTGVVRAPPVQGVPEDQPHQAGAKARTDVVGCTHIFVLQMLVEKTARTNFIRYFLCLNYCSA